jgi:hypothetical protein
LEKSVACLTGRQAILQQNVYKILYINTIVISDYIQSYSCFYF